MSVLKTKKIQVLAEVYGKSMSPEAIAAYVKLLKDFTDEEVNIACNKVMEEAGEFMPKPQAVIKKCGKISAWLKAKRLKDGVFVCKYYDPQECQDSKDLCQKMEADDMQASTVQGWEPLCNWHYCVTYAKYFPDTNTARFVADRLHRQKTQIAVETDIDISKIGKKVA